MVERLPDTSMTTALASGGRSFFGWGQDRMISADLYDAVNINTQATGHWKKDPPKIPPYPRPKSKAKRASDPPKRVNLKQLHSQLFRRARAAQQQ